MQGMCLSIKIISMTPMRNIFQDTERTSMYTNDMTTVIALHESVSIPFLLFNVLKGVLGAGGSKQMHLGANFVLFMLIACISLCEVPAFYD